MLKFVYMTPKAGDTPASTEGRAGCLVYFVTNFSLDEPDRISHCDGSLDREDNNP